MFSQISQIFTDFLSVFICVTCLPVGRSVSQICSHRFRGFSRIISVLNCVILEYLLIYYSYQALFIFEAADIEINQNPDFLS
jgi:hypothetical protein